jgi:hypothetical protein
MPPKYIRKRPQPEVASDPLSVALRAAAATAERPGVRAWLLAMADAPQAGERQGARRREAAVPK